MHIWQKVLNECVEWHIDTFEEDKCTFESQLLKLEEEIREASEAALEGVDEYIEELVDVLIVSYVLSVRYKSELGAYVFTTVHSEIQSKCPQYYNKIEKAIENKLERNKRRTWIFIDGKYHHTKENTTNVIQ